MAAASLLLMIVLQTCIVSLFGQDIDIHCNNVSQCVGTHWELSSSAGGSGQTIFGRGYKSIYGPTTSITGLEPTTAHTVMCNAAFACEQISFIGSWGPVSCGGSHSCANVNGTSYIRVELGYGEVGCAGANSCQNSNITASDYDYVHCAGSKSCLYSNITSAQVWANGIHSLFESIIESNTAELHVRLWGYQSGFGANVLCKSQQTCNIYCYSNGCQMLYLDCEPNSDCTVILNNDTLTIPPIQNMSDYDYSLYDSKYDIFNNNELCENALNFVYDNYYEKSGIIEVNQQNPGPVCCRADSSCQNVDSINTVDIVVCSGTLSCSGTLINTTKPIFCEGALSCRAAIINGANNVYCLGWYACSYSVIRQSANVYCLSGNGCTQGTITSNGTDINIYLLGSGSGERTDIYCDLSDKCFIKCGGKQSCLSNTVLHCNDNCIVECDTDTGCPKGDYTLKIPTFEPTTINPTTLIPTTATATTEKPCRPKPCIKSCKKSDGETLKDGDYQSCNGCSVYASCSNGVLYDNRPCAPWFDGISLQWDDNKKSCEWESETCCEYPETPETNKMGIFAIATFTVNESGVDGTIKVDENGNVIIDLDISKLDISMCEFGDREERAFKYAIYDSYKFGDLKSRKGNECAKHAIGEVYNPFNAKKCSQYIINGNGDTFLECRIGDLSEQFGDAIPKKNQKLRIEGNMSKKGGFCESRLDPQSLYQRSIVFACKDRKETIAFCAPFQVQTFVYL